MAFNDSIDMIKNLLNEAAQTAVRATKSAAALTKANVNLQTEQSKQKKAYMELGKLYYRDFITGEEPDEAEYLPLCDAITEATKTIEELKNTLEELKASVFPAKEEAEEPVEAETEEAAPDLEAELKDLHKELDDLEEELHKLDGVEEAPAAPVFEVVEDRPAEEPKTEEAPENPAE